MDKFTAEDLKKIYKPPIDSCGEDNGQITIIGGSSLFHGAPILALTIASKFVDMVFFTSPEKSLGLVAEQLKSRLSSFIWVPENEIEHYIEKSDAVLIGPGLMRYHSEKTKAEERYTTCDEVCKITKEITEKLLKKFPHKKWVIDAGSLQTMEPSWIPPHAILTPNKKEYELLFGKNDPSQMAKKYNCIIVDKGKITKVYSPEGVITVEGGNAGLTKGGTGDTQAGLTVSLLSKNEPLLAASAAAYLIKKTADEIYDKKGTYYNADDVAEGIPEVLHKLTK